MPNPTWASVHVFSMILPLSLTRRAFLSSKPLTTVQWSAHGAPGGAGIGMNEGWLGFHDSGLKAWLRSNNPSAVTNPGMDGSAPPNWRLIPEQLSRLSVMA